MEFILELLIVFIQSLFLPFYLVIYLLLNIECVYNKNDFLTKAKNYFKNKLSYIVPMFLFLFGTTSFFFWVGKMILIA